MYPFVSSQRHRITQTLIHRREWSHFCGPYSPHQLSYTHKTNHSNSFLLWNFTIHPTICKILEDGYIHRKMRINLGVQPSVLFILKTPTIDLRWIQRSKVTDSLHSSSNHNHTSRIGVICLVLGHLNDVIWQLFNLIGPKAISSLPNVGLDLASQPDIV